MFSGPAAFSQVKTNLDQFYFLADSSIKSLITDIPDTIKEADIQFYSADGFRIFNSRVINTLSRNGIKIKKNSAFPVSYAVENASITYGDMERDGFLGSYIIPRTVMLTGSYFVEGKNPVAFSFSVNDTIKADDLPVVENQAFPFTRGNVPAETFFSGLFEPVVAIGVSAAAVILFFTIRSK